MTSRLTDVFNTYYFYWERLAIRLLGSLLCAKKPVSDNFGGCLQSSCEKFRVANYRVCF